MNYSQQYVSFITALQWHVGIGGHGTKAHIAKNCDTSASFIGQILKQDAIKKAKLDTQIKIGQFLEGSFETFIELGEKIIEFNTEFPTLEFSKEYLKPAQPTPANPAVELLQEIMKETGLTINEKNKGRVKKTIRQILIEGIDDEQEAIESTGDDGFKNKEKALKAIQLLHKLESLNKREFYKFIADLEGLVEELDDKNKDLEAV